MKKIVIGFLAHVDSGKTTLSEAVLYRAGAIRKLGRVDHKDAFLDTDSIERNRGITVFSKEARFCIAPEGAGGTVLVAPDEALEVTLLDTPGHRDFTAEMERTLSVLDYAVLIISGPDMIQEQTEVIWELLKAHHVPTIIFVNKMDRAGLDKGEIMQGLKSYFGDGTFEVGTDGLSVVDYEEVAVGSDELTEMYFSGTEIGDELIRQGISSCKLRPVFFGSALKLTGIDEFLQGLAHFTEAPKYGLNFSAKVYKIDRDKAGSRLTHMKITGGVLKTKQLLDGEKVDQIRIYAGDSFKLVQEAEAGDVVCVTGLNRTSSGSNFMPARKTPRKLSGEFDPAKAAKELEVLNEEDPTLELCYDELTEEIRIKTMGEGSLEEEILRERILDRFGLAIEFAEPSVYVAPKELVLSEDGYWYDEEGNAFDEEGNPVELETDEERQESFELWRHGSDEQKKEERDLNRIFKKTYGESKRDKQMLEAAQARATRLKAREEDNFPQPNWKGSKGNTHLIVDGYNVIFAWDELKDVASANFDAAREVLIEVLQNYQGFRKIGITLVFDGYKVPGNIGTEYMAGDIRVVYTKEGQTADRFIEEMVFELGKHYDLTTVTSDLPVQMATLGDGARRMSAREFHQEVIQTSEEIRTKLTRLRPSPNRPFEGKI